MPVGMSATLMSLIWSLLLERATKFTSQWLLLKGKVHTHAMPCQQCPQSLWKLWATGISCKAFQVPADSSDVSEGSVLHHTASVRGTKRRTSEDLSSSWSHMPCRAHSSPQCAAALLEVSHHFIFSDFPMFLPFFFLKKQHRHCYIWQKNKDILFKACVVQYQLGQTIALLDLNLKSQLDKEWKGSKSQVRKNLYLHLVSKGLCFISMLFLSVIPLQKPENSISFSVDFSPSDWHGSSFQFAYATLLSMNVSVAPVTPSKPAIHFFASLWQQHHSPGVSSAGCTFWGRCWVMPQPSHSSILAWTPPASDGWGPGG